MCPVQTVTYVSGRSLLTQLALLAFLLEIGPCDSRFWTQLDATLIRLESSWTHIVIVARADLN